MEEKEQIIKDLEHNTKNSDIWAIGVPRGEKECGKIFGKIMDKNFTNLAGHKPIELICSAIPKQDTYNQIHS